jgi:N-acetylglucosaminyldiphosphoundecaprenol N-acetyl-beta-D-mannosaminyltransferase
MPKVREILGVRVDLVSRGEALEIINGFLGKSDGLKFVGTVYSEFLVRASEDGEFRGVLNQADLAVPDGVSILAADKYKRELEDGGNKFLSGLAVAGDIWQARLGQTVTGVWLFEELVRQAAEKGWRVFLLGGFGSRAVRLGERLRLRYDGLQLEADAGEVNVGSDDRENERVIEKINSFRPDLLFVAYGPVKQEKWIVKNRGRLKAKVAMGVGGTFDEVLGEVARSPLWMERRGLKWLWRLMVQPKRIGRIYKAVVVFPWKVFRAV